MKRILARAAAVCLSLSVLVVSGCGDDGAAADKILYIWSTDSSTALTYDEVLTTQYGYAVDLVDIAFLDTVSVSDYVLVMVGTTTTSGTGWSGTTDDVNAIVDSNVPVIAMGNGGARFLDESTTNLGWMDSWIATGTTLVALDGSHDVFTTPNPIMLPVPSMELPVYDTDNSMIAVYLDPVPAAVEALGRQAGNATHYLVAREGRFLQWGFTQDAADLSAAGADFLQNVIEYMRTQ